MRLCRCLLAVAVLWGGWSGQSAEGSTITFDFSGQGAGTFSAAGSFTQDNDVVLILLSVSQASLLTAQTLSYAVGGFDPVFTLYDAAGAWLSNWDDRDSSTGDFDAFVSSYLLLPGFYTLALTQSPNFGQVTLGSGFDFDGMPFFTYMFYGTSSTACTAFVDANGDCRTALFDASLSIVSATPVPEPGTMLLVGTGIAAVLARRRRASRR